jgi:hypothetical protein
LGTDLTKKKPNEKIASKIYHDFRACRLGAMPTPAWCQTLSAEQRDGVVDFERRSLPMVALEL